MISVESLTKQYGRFTAVDNVSFTAATGRVTMYLLMAAWGAVTYLTVKEVTQKRIAAVLVALYFPLCVFPLPMPPGAERSNGAP